MNRLHYSNFAISGFTYYDGPIVFSELNIGTRLRFVREKENKYDANAVAIYFGESKIGFVPRDENEEIAKFLDLGYDEMFEVRINRIVPEAHPESQISVTVYIRRRN